jgi:bifunctional oligoribonuclease and PAP phosphatase NrnA
MNTPQQILDQIKKSSSVLLVCHPGTDYDSVSSNLALYFFLNKIGKKAKIIFADNSPNPAHTFLPSYDLIKQETWQEQDLSGFDLLVCLDISSLNQITKRSELVFPSSLTVIVIDHHRSNQAFGNLNLIDPDSPATAQILYRLFKEWKIDITPDIATCLFAGLYDDSKFKYPGTNQETYLTAADLISVGIDLDQIIFNIDNSHTQKSLKYLELALQNQKYYFQNQVVITAISHQELDRHRIQKHDQNIQPQNIIKSAIGNDLIVILCENEPAVCSVSLRSRDQKKYDVSLLASALGGGGHATAAGCRIEGDTKKAIEVLLEAIPKIYPNLSS